MGYVIDFCDGNYKNDLDVTITDTDIERDHIHSGCEYNKINNRRQNPTIQFLSAVGNIKAIVLPLDITTIVIFYYNKGRLILLNN